VGGYAPDPVQKIGNRKLRNANVNLPIALFAQAEDCSIEAMQNLKVLYDLSGVVMPIVLLCIKHFRKRIGEVTAYGYARVSTNGQDLAAQEAELIAAGAAKVFKEKVSGAKADRAELAKVIRRLEPGDLLLVTRLDRLARSTRDLLNVLATIPQSQGHMGGYHNTARPAHVDGAWWLGRVRARANPRPYERRQNPRESPRRAFRPSICPHATPTPRGHPEA
jgi:Resolvase, N terminal domain